MTTWEGVGHTSWRGRAPLAAAAVIPAVVLLALPWRSHQLATVPGFGTVWLTLLVGCDVLTVLLLLDQYRAGGSPRLLVLASGFLWSAGAAVLIALSVPGIVQAHPTFAADPNSLEWLWVSRHVVPPLLIGLALAPRPPTRERTDAQQRRPSRTTQLLLAWTLVPLLTLLTALVVAEAPGRLPSITGPTDRLDGPVMAAVVALNLVAVALAVAGVAPRGGAVGVERWAVVAPVTFLGDVALTALDEPRYSVAYYLARLLGLAAAAFVMFAVLRESARIQERTSEVAHRLEDRNAELLATTRMREHLTTMVSHDLRTPLAGLQGYLEILRDEDLSTTLARRMLERSWMLTRRLTLLTEDLLAAATLEHADLVITPERLDLGRELGECASCFPDLDLQLDVPPGLTVHADPLRLQQVLTNLVRNAQKHGAEPVRIAAADRRAPGGVTIRVSDAGPGVPAAFVPRLFERYSQGAATATGGSGLGLSVVRDLVTAHGGTIRYDPAGNAFVLTLPPPAAVPAPADRPATVVRTTALRPVEAPRT